MTSSALPRQERARLKRVALLRAAESEFANVGFEATTAKSIAALAGVATGTFYQYFDNKNQILRVIAADRYSQLHEHINWFEKLGYKKILSQSDIVDVFRRMFRIIYDFHAMNPELHQVLEQRKTIDDELMAIMAQGERVLYAPILSFVQRFDIDNAETFAVNIFAMGEGVVHHQIFNNKNLNTEDVLESGAQMMASYFLDRH